ncbi:MAG: hypothetical protein CXT73_04820 [Methanobacteriota archaeon]|nr:MAG: hypothetical protein CXT73_04820 [Euryarchaeota archaeon]
MMQNDSANLQYILQENKKNNDKVSYEDVLQQVDTLDEALPDMEIQYIYEEEAILGMDDYLASELDYQTNYIKKDLERIADYYEISKRKKRKDELVEAIVLFEKDPVNIQKVYQRKKLWKYMEEIKKDKYLRQFLILD